MGQGDCLPSPLLCYNYVIKYDIRSVKINEKE